MQGQKLIKHTYLAVIVNQARFEPCEEVARALPSEKSTALGALLEQIYVL